MSGIVSRYGPAYFLERGRSGQGIEELWKDLGAAGLLRITGLHVALGLVGAVVLIVMGGRTLMSAFRVRLGAETDDEVSEPWPAFRTSLAATAVT